MGEAHTLLVPNENDGNAALADDGRDSEWIAWEQAAAAQNTASVRENDGSCHVGAQQHQYTPLFDCRASYVAVVTDVSINGGSVLGKRKAQYQITPQDGAVCSERPLEGWDTVPEEEQAEELTGNHSLSTHRPLTVGWLDDMALEMLSTAFPEGSELWCGTEPQDAVQLLYKHVYNYSMPRKTTF